MREDVYGYKSSINVYNVDMKRKARPAGLLRAMQECGSRQMADQRPSYDELLDKGQALMLSRLDMIIPREVYLDEPIDVYTWPCPSMRATFLRNYLVRKNGETAAMISSQWSLVNSETRRIMKVEDVDFSNFTMYEYVDVMPESKFKISREDADALAESEPVGFKTVRLSDVDYNGHMNNTRCMEWVDDLLPSEFHGAHHPREFTVCYYSEGKEGQELTLRWDFPESGVLQADSYRREEDREARVFSLRIRYE